MVKMNSAYAPWLLIPCEMIIILQTQTLVSGFEMLLLLFADLYAQFLFNVQSCSLTLNLPSNPLLRRDYLVPI